MTNSPFKLLDSYTKEDKDIFFGRDSEIEKLGITHPNIQKVRELLGANKETKDNE